MKITFARKYSSRLVCDGYAAAKIWPTKTSGPFANDSRSLLGLFNSRRIASISFACLVGWNQNRPQFSVWKKDAKMIYKLLIEMYRNKLSDF